MQWFLFRERELLVVDEGDLARTPRSDELPGPLDVDALEIGTFDGVACVAARITEGPSWPYGFASLRSLWGRTDERIFRLAGRALQLVEWDETHRFCGRCGEATERSRTEHVRTCPRCGLTAFPRVSPAVIMSVVDGDRILLARHPRLPAAMYSVLAGFVEPGETLEETVAREVREEVGLEVDDIRYFGSQPWPFPHSLMVAFTTRFAGGELRPDPAEIEDAGWYRADALPRVSPRISIARALIDAFVEEQGG